MTKDIEKEREILKNYFSAMDNKRFDKAIEVSKVFIDNKYANGNQISWLVARACDLLQNKEEESIEWRKRIILLYEDVIFFLKAEDNENTKPLGWWAYHSLVIARDSWDIKRDGYQSTKEQLEVVYEMNSSLFSDTSIGSFHTLLTMSVEKFKLILLPDEYSANKIIN